MWRIRRLAMLIGLLGLTQAAQADRLIITGNRTAASGHTLRLVFLNSINPDCSSRGLTQVRIVQQPAHGVFIRRTASEFPTAPRNTTVSHCNTQRVRGELLEYRPASGFAGYDSLTVDAIFPTGNERQMTFNITVK